jgi:hypothetical protein
MAMEEIGANTTPILSFLDAVSRKAESIGELSYGQEMDQVVIDFLSTTFNTIECGKMHYIAASFAFDREDIIPDMFMKVVNGLDKTAPIPAFRY